MHAMVQAGETRNIVETRPSLYLLMGQIKGVTHVSCNDLVNRTNEIKKPEEVRAILESKGVDLSKPIYITCGWGITVCVLEAALSPLQGV